jgi:hypothetical protein
MLVAQRGAVTGLGTRDEDRSHTVGYPPGVGATSDSSVLIISSTLESDWRAITGCFASDSPWESAGMLWVRPAF